MLLIKNHFEEFYSVAGRKKIVAFGASDFLRLISLNYKELRLEQYIDCVVDNNAKKQGKSIEINGCKKNIVSPEMLLTFDADTTAVLISSDVYAYEIYVQLEEMLKDKNMDVFVLSLMISAHVDEMSNAGNLVVHQGQEIVIPKIIHYFWFSGEKKTDLAEKCIESWKRTCPDYEIKEWNTDNYDVSVNAFVYEAYRQKKWAYVSDYARLDTVYKYGGIYLDLDVILYKCMDALLKHDFFIGFGPIRDIEAAAFGAKPRCRIVKEMLEIYENKKFDPNTSITLLQLQPVLLDRFFEKKGFQINGKYQEKDRITIYPRDVFSAKNWFTGEYELTDAAVGIHECAGGWTSNGGKSSKQIKMEGTKKLIEIYKGQLQK